MLVATDCCLKTNCSEIVTTLKLIHKIDVRTVHNNDCCHSNGVNSIARPEKVCCLCGRVGGYMIHFEHWSEKEKDYALAHLNTLPPIIV